MTEGMRVPEEYRSPEHEPQVGEEACIMLKCDPFAKYNYIVTCLVNILGHGVYQAEQCIRIAWNTGRCVVKEGLTQDLMKTQQTLQRKGICILYKCPAGIERTLTNIPTMKS